MADWLIIFWLTLAAGLAMVLGAIFASIEHISPRWLETEFRHSVIAFGGGILVAAVALVLIPEGMQHLPSFYIGLTFLLGGLVFMALDRLLNRKRLRVSQLFAMLLDFLPEVCALGALYLLARQYALLLGLLIALQNLPEGFNAYRELLASGRYKGRTIIWTFFALSFLGPIAGLKGYFFLTDYPPVTSGIMLFASGGILYLIFQDIAPQAVLKRHWGPSLGAVIGFLFGMIGKLMIEAL